MLPKWVLNGAALIGLLYFVLKVLKRKFYLNAHDAGLKFTYVRAVGASPDHLIVVVNGLFGKSTAGRHVVDAAVEEAERQNKSIVAARLQVSDLLFDNQLFSEGVHAASQHAVEIVRRICGEFPTLKKVSLLGSSFGGLVLRNAAPDIVADLLEPHALVCMCSPHSGAPQLRETWWMRMLVPVVPMQW